MLRLWSSPYQVKFIFPYVYMPQSKTTMVHCYTFYNTKLLYDIYRFRLAVISQYGDLRGKYVFSDIPINNIDYVFKLAQCDNILQNIVCSCCYFPSRKCSWEILL